MPAAVSSAVAVPDHTLLKVLQHCQVQPTAGLSPVGRSAAEQVSMIGTKRKDAASRLNKISEGCMPLQQAITHT